MNKLILGGALGLLFAATVASAQAPTTGRVTPEFPKSGSPAIVASPGATAPGSEMNAVTSPTSPELPISKQAPPEIPANSGASNGTSGANRPHTQDTPSGNPQD